MKTVTSAKTRFWLAFHGGLLLFSAGVAMLKKYQQYGEPLHPTVLVPFFTIFIMSVCIGYLAIFYVNKARTYKLHQLNRRIVPGLLIFFVASWIIAQLSITLGVFGWYIAIGRDLSGFWSHLINHELAFGDIGFFMGLLFFAVTFFYTLWYKTAQREQALREENLSFRYRTLKAQLNPHFLFNSLNTLSELVHVDPVIAERYISRLSSVYRYILKNEENDFVTLAEELEFVEMYFELQKERDDEKIKLAIDVNGKQDYSIMPVSLQLLVENALKHNMRSKENPLVISITREKDFVEVSNNIQKKNTFDNSSPTGLANLRERAKLLMNREPVVSETKDFFSVKVPLKIDN